MPKIVKGYPFLWVFQTFNLLQNIKKVQGGPSGDIENFEKSLTLPKKWKGRPFSIV